MDKHIEMIHFGMMLFKCEHCDKKFSKKFNLQVHLNNAKAKLLRVIRQKQFIQETFKDKQSLIATNPNQDEIKLTIINNQLVQLLPRKYFPATS